MSESIFNFQIIQLQNYHNSSQVSLKYVIMETNTGNHKLIYKANE